MKKYNMLFIGDSITSGVYSDGRMDYTRKGYPDFICEELKSRNLLGFFYNIAVAGFTTKDVLRVLAENITYNENIAFNITPEHSYKKNSYKKKQTIKLLNPDIYIDDMVREADIITMTLGSNDIIKYIASYGDNLKNLNIKEVFENKNKGEFFLNYVIVNFKKIIDFIREKNAYCKIVIIGSYTPNKYDAVNKIFDKYLRIIENKILSNLLEYDSNVQTIHIRDEVLENRKYYLDNPLGVHLNEQGYKMIANKFLQEVKL